MGGGGTNTSCDSNVLFCVNLVQDMEGSLFFVSVIYVNEFCMLKFNLEPIFHICINVDHM